MHTFRVVTTYLKLSVLNEMQYRANFFMQVFNSVLALGVGLAGLALVLYQTDSLGGWTGLELLVLVGVFTLIGGVLRSFIQPNMREIAEGVREGTLDYTITKPADTQLLVSVTRFEMWRLIDVFIGIGVLVFAVIQLGSQVGIVEILAFTLVLFCGGLIFYSFWLLIATMSFWVIRTWSMFEMFENLYSTGRWPVGIYPTWLRAGLTFLVPVAFAVTAPASALTDRLMPQTVLLVLAMTVVSLFVSRRFWHYGLKNYSGASA